MGIFDPMNLVCKLDASISEPLQREGLIHETNKRSPEAFAFATLLHETVHWWQYVGTSSGIIAALTIPLQTHVIRQPLLELVQGEIPQKPIHWEVFKNPKRQDPLRSLVNRIVNNWMDIEFSYALLDDPKHAPTLCNDDFFDSIGHSHSVHLANAWLLLTSTFDQDVSADRLEAWATEFGKLRERRVRGYYRGSPAVLPPLGALHIREGQARISELQYRALACGETWEDFERLGLLRNEYRLAFDTFLKVLGINRPDDPLSNVVDIFCLLCDIALNPSVGYPDDIVDFQSFAFDINPGVRFLTACNVLRAKPNLIESLKYNNKQDYDRICAEICHPIGWKTPIEVAASIVRWFRDMRGTGEILTEAISGECKPENLSVRFVCGRHLLLLHDKIERPDFFCWPAHHMTFMLRQDKHEDEIIRSLLVKNHPIFVTRGLNTAVGVHKGTGWTDAVGARLLATYFRWQLHYDLIRQWVSESGAFNYDYSWLDPTKTPSEYERWLTNGFSELFGCGLADIRPNPDCS
jgi:hypothetical protein